MKILFWQNMLSIHQSALIKSLSEEHEVLLVVEHAMDDDRVGTGWSIPDMGKAQIFVSPSQNDADRILNDHKDAIHIFSGISAYPLIYRQFKRACKKGYFILNYLETYNYLGVSGKMRRLKYTLLRLRYGRYIKGILATGKTAIKAYKSAGFDDSTLFDWGYFTESSSDTPSDQSGKHSSTLPDIIYVGKLDHRKRILPLIQILSSMSDLFNKFHIIGTGPLQNELLSLINLTSSFEYHGSIENRKAQIIMADCDLLILPSAYDGWGAVVNEALMQGTPVICSVDCGASVLLQEKWRGETFSWEKEHNLPKVLRNHLIKGKTSTELREKIKAWATENLSGKRAASYLIEIVNYIEGLKPRPVAPWIKDEK